jgi:hypothetical protein
MQLWVLFTELLSRYWVVAEHPEVCKVKTRPHTQPTNVYAPVERATCQQPAGTMATGAILGLTGPSRTC